MSIAYNKNYFKEKVGYVLPEHLDNIFNIFTNYVNNTLRLETEKIGFANTTGVIGPAGQVFCNIDDYTTGYDWINDIHYDDNSLTLNKLEEMEAGSVFVYTLDGRDGNIKATGINADYDDQLLFADRRRGFSFRRIKNEDIDNISYDKLISVAVTNFVDTILDTLIQDNSIESVSLENIPNIKFEEDSISFEHIGIFYDLPYDDKVAGKISVNELDVDSLSPDKIKDGTVTFALMKQNYQYFSLPRDEPTILQDGFIDDSFFFPHDVVNIPIYNGKYVYGMLGGTGWISNFHWVGLFHEENNIHPRGNPLIDNFKLPREKIALKSIGPNHFTQEIKTAITNYKNILNPPYVPPVQPRPQPVKPTVVVQPTQYEIQYGNNTHRHNTPNHIMQIGGTQWSISQYYYYPINRLNPTQEIGFVIYGYGFKTFNESEGWRQIHVDPFLSKKYTDQNAVAIDGRGSVNFKEII